MKYESFLEEYIDPFTDVSFIYDEDRGYIVWRLGTGQNVELLHIRTFEHGQGYGKELFHLMLDALKDDAPYYSIFGFTRVSNNEAHNFYAALGFELQPIKGLYKDGLAIMFWQSYYVLLTFKESL